MKKILAAISILAIAGVTVFATTSTAADRTRAQEGEIFLGSADAPVEIVEYASATCGHCGTFHKDILPKIKKKYIDTGKVKFVLRDMPWDNLAYGVATISRCSDDYYTFMGVFMDTQRTWLGADNKMDAIKQIARLGGMDSETVDKCMSNKEISGKIADGAKIGKELGVSGTPSFFINGVLHPGVPTVERMSQLIDEALTN